MRQAVSKKLQAAGAELLWVMGSYVVALSLMRAWLGYATLDIQMHNIYFVLRAVDIAVPLAILLAAVADVSRLVSSRWRTPYTVTALATLAATWLLLVAIVFWWVRSGLRAGHVQP
jgi:hypothetical protein